MFDVMKLAATLTLNTKDYEQDLSETLAKTEKVGGAIGRALGGATAFAIKGLAIGVSAASAGIVKLAKDSTAAYAEMEQMIGGAQLMFGDAFSVVEENAKNAFNTVQMSQTEYLREANKYATGLKQALGGDAEAAADLTHKIIKAEADLVAATGRDRESIENAFAGVMRGNYTMLDNLQIGIKGSKEGMQDVVDKVNAWKAAQGEATNYQMGNYADMQAALVDYVEMVGYAGYATKEAGDTIQGSMASAQAAWQNLVAGFADENANLAELTSNFLEAASGAAENMMPRIEQALDGIGQFVETAVPMILEKIPPMLQNIVPKILETAKNLTQSVIETLPALIEGISAFLPEMAQGGIDLLLTLGEGLISALPSLIEGGMQALSSLLDAILDRLPELIEMGINMIVALANGLAQAIPTLVQAIPQIIVSIGKAIIKNLPTILKAGWDVGKALLQGIWNGIMGLGSWLFRKVGDFFGSIKKYICEIFGIHSPSKWGAEVGEYLMEGFANGIEDGGETVEKEVDETLNDLKTRLTTGIEKIEQALEQVTDKGQKKILQNQLSQLKDFQKEYEGLWDEIARRQESTINKLADFGGLFKRYREDDKEIFEIADIDEQIAKLEEYGESFEKLRGKGVSEGLLHEILNMTVDDASGYMDKLLEMNDERLTEYVAKYEEKQALAGSLGRQIYQTEFDKLQEVYDENMPESIKTMLTAGEEMMQALAEGIENGESAVVNAVSSSVGAAIAQANSMAGISAVPTSQTKATNAIMNKMARDESRFEKQTFVSVQIDGKEVAKAVQQPLKKANSREGRNFVSKASNYK